MISKTNPQSAEDIFKLILGHLDISDEFYQKYLKGIRCISIFTALTRNKEQWQEIRLQIDGSNDTEAFHVFLDLIQFIQAVKFYKKTIPGNIDWTNISQDEIYDIIEAHVEYIRATDKEQGGTLTGHLKYMGEKLDEYRFKVSKIKHLPSKVEGSKEIPSEIKEKKEFPSTKT